MTEWTEKQLGFKGLPGTFTGELSNYDQATKEGTIKVDSEQGKGLPKEVIVRQSSFMGFVTIKEGDRLSFRILLNKKDPAIAHASDVRVIPATTSRITEMRSG